MKEKNIVLAAIALAIVIISVGVLGDNIPLFTQSDTDTITIDTTRGVHDYIRQDVTFNKSTLYELGIMVTGSVHYTYGYGVRLSLYNSSDNKIYEGSFTNFNRASLEPLYLDIAHSNRGEPVSVVPGDTYTVNIEFFDAVHIELTYETGGGTGAYKINGGNWTYINGDFLLYPVYSTEEINAQVNLQSPDDGATVQANPSIKYEVSTNVAVKAQANAKVYKNGEQYINTATGFHTINPPSATVEDTFGVIDEVDLYTEWWVEVRDSDNNLVATSETRSFTIGEAPPPSPPDCVTTNYYHSEMWPPDVNPDSYPSSDDRYAVHGYWYLNSGDMVYITDTYGDYYYLIVVGQESREVSYWETTGDGVWGGLTCIPYEAANESIEALDNMFTYTLSVNVDTHMGTVRISPDMSSYPAGTEVTLTANNFTGYTFDHWEGDVASASYLLSASNNPLTITMDRDRSITACFVEDTTDTYSLSVESNPSNGGTVQKSTDGPYNPGDTVTLMATSEPGYVFTGWSGDASGSSQSTTITMNSDKTVTAEFTSGEGDNLTLWIMGAVGLLAASLLIFLVYRRKR